jgi:hypothetical protein
MFSPFVVGRTGGAEPFKPRDSARRIFATRRTMCASPMTTPEYEMNA